MVAPSGCYEYPTTANPHLEWCGGWIRSLISRVTNYYPRQGVGHDIYTFIHFYTLLQHSHTFTFLHILDVLTYI